ncbi:hypothetical protein SPRG_19953 [Saprolegnia parasitica CBS 223.65]|uniref:Ribonuclease P/MRP protein subunit POP5 n=1 Tax=Saprolegnia parasitica (strain CBS 223.65) TaxID=695850 RepID=A0A067CQE7_SAPPC|nr:hypothetical protein SPRG_19953 [Saprolegnia parasitica CBS 223.65]KDO28736.1 hypothetical protein SPRG_19953 [Saprolegnia parasitica CBS 223.65]|eukprot:XP_012200486.1 hypothetical protein SPRG_19953 [Saprolegnia parasitica CBS 223.65]
MVRFKNRYFIVEVTFGRGKKGPALTARDIYSLVLAAIGSNYGDFGVGTMQAALQVLYYNAITHLAVVRCGRDDATKVHACLTFLTEAQHQDAKFRTVVVCGSSRTVKDTLLRLSRERIQDAKLATTHPTIEADLVVEIAGLDSPP